MGIRRAVFSGSWYPADAGACESEIRKYLEEVDTTGVAGRSLVGGIVPHAGWFFSGAIACNVIHALASPEVDLVVLFGMHLHESSPRYMMKAGEWETPFGPLAVDEEIAEALAAEYSFTIETETRFTQDNTIELQLPFVKYFFKNAKVLALGMPPVPESIEIAEFLAGLIGEKGRRARVIGSTDLTHYGMNYGFSPKGDGQAAVDWVTEVNDPAVVDTMVEMDPSALLGEARRRHNACCAGAAAAAVAAGKKLGAGKGTLLKYGTSLDRGPGESFVGYAGLVF